MLDFLVALIFGWPLIGIALAVFLYGVWKKQVKTCVLGMVLSLPFAFYLFGSDPVLAASMLLPQLGAIWAVAKQKDAIAWFFSGIVIFFVLGLITKI